ncbi:hypothetical protein [Modestobacter excelsi]|uniref:hypothetical protein n=1 Tax=Modestobacter excelsi TaxID=2213161 RepID=UPI00110CAE1A|nr:hypothetical protein [Modestobacter excelsi]
MAHPSEAVVRRLHPLLVEVRDALLRGLAVSRVIHATHDWQPTADRHLDHQLVRREAMERLRPYAEHVDHPFGTQLELLEPGNDNLGLPMSGLILRTPTEVLRVWHSEDGELPAADTHGLRDFYSQAPTAQLRLQLAFDAVPVAPARREHLALLWADSRAPGRDPELVRFDLVRPRGSSGRRVDVDWHVGLLDRLRSNAA